MSKFLLLGLIQGLTEFLPISSSGHLALLENFLRVTKPGVLFDVLVHLGTLVSVLYFYRARIWLLLKAPFKRDENLRFLLLLIIATIPTAVLGLLFKNWVEAAFQKNIIVGLSLLVTGVILYLAEKRGEGNKSIAQMSFFEAILVGIMQGIAIFPGISRSGFTISMGIFLGLRREVAAEFSFILSIPAILGAAVLQGWEALANPAIHQGFLGAYALGMLFAAISGILAIKFLLVMLRGRRLRLFAYYCWGIGVLAIILWLMF